MTAKSSLNEPWDFKVGNNTTDTYFNYFNVNPPCEHIFDITYGWLWNLNTSLYCGGCGAREEFPKMWRIPHMINAGEVYQRRMQLPTPNHNEWQKLNNQNFIPKTVYDWQYDAIRNTQIKIGTGTELWNDNHTYPNLNLDTTLKWINGT